MEENSMQEILKKAEVLIEALPYIQRFNRKIIVVKYGGSAMVDEELKQSVIQDVTLLKLVGFKPIIVHSRGPYPRAAVGHHPYPRRLHQAPAGGGLPYPAPRRPGHLRRRPQG